MMTHDLRPRTAGLALAALLATQSPAAAPEDDPNAWLEDADDPRSLAWVEAENAKTVGVLKEDPHYARFYAEALAIAENEDRIPRPSWVGERLVNFRRDAAHPHGIWRMTTPESYAQTDTEWETLLDLDALAALAALAAAEDRNCVWKGATCESVSPRRCLTGLSDGGTDAVTLREFDLEKRGFVADGFALPTSKQFAAWLAEDTLLVARDWGDDSLTASGYPFIVKRLARGAPLHEADTVFRGAAEDQGPVRPSVLVDGNGNRAVLMLRSPTFHENEIHLLEDGRLRRLPLPGRVSISGLLDGKLVARLSEPWRTPVDGRIEAGAIVAVALDELREGDDFAVETIIAPAAARRCLGVLRRDNRTARRRVRDSDRLPGSGDAVGGTRHRRNGGRGQGAARAVRRRDAHGPAIRSRLHRRHAHPVFRRAAKDAPRDGSTPTILTAYGGFQVSHIPTYKPAIGKLWLERGGAYAVANIRGGGEFGPAWHQAGLTTKRQTVYDDFAAVGEDLIARKLTSRHRLGIMGGSNGGLLMGVALTQRPDLWRGVVIRVPLLDMLRYEQIAAGASWVAEYGSVSVPAERAFLEKTSPYANLERDSDYPQPLIWTTAKDDRVGPGHARKFAARMKAFGHPYYYYENLDAAYWWCAQRPPIRCCPNDAYGQQKRAGGHYSNSHRCLPAWCAAHTILSSLPIPATTTS